MQSHKHNYDDGKERATAYLCKLGMMSSIPKTYRTTVIDLIKQFHKYLWGKKNFLPKREGSPKFAKWLANFGEPEEIHVTSGYDVDIEHRKD